MHVAAKPTDTGLVLRHTDICVGIYWAPLLYPDLPLSSLLFSLPRSPLPSLSMLYSRLYRQQDKLQVADRRRSASDGFSIFICTAEPLGPGSSWVQTSSHTKLLLHLFTSDTVLATEQGQAESLVLTS